MSNETDLARIIHDVVFTELSDKAYERGIGAPLTLQGAEQVAAACAARVVAYIDGRQKEEGSDRP